MDQLLAYLQHRAGESLRAVVRYSDDDRQVIHSRSDLDPGTIATRADEVYDAVTSTAETPVTDHLGTKYASVHLRQEVVVLDIRRTRTSGVLVSLEPDCAERLTGFVAACSERVRSDGFSWT